MPKAKNHATDRSPLLTKEARSAKYNELFAGRLAHPRALFLPNQAFYDKLATQEGLVEAAKELYHWLGIKPRSVRVQFGGAKDNDTILIPEAYRHLPYLAGATLTLGVIHEAITHYRKHPADTAFVEFVSLESGLGIVIANALYAPHGVWEDVIHNIHGQWHISTDTVTQAYHPANYLEELRSYASACQLSPHLWAGYLHTEARKPLELTIGRGNYEQPPTAETTRRRKALGNAARVVLLAILAGGITTTSIYILSQRPATPPKQAAEQYQEVVSRKAAYDSCTHQAEQFEHTNTLDTAASQELNAIKARCSSLQHDYNTALTHYNDLLPD